MSALQRTPLFAFNQQRGARFVDFGGWEMPVQFKSILDEHRLVRTRAGLFDVSHMGEVEVTGPDAARFLDFLVTNDVAKLFPGRVLYTVMCQPDGGVVDDLLIYCRGPQDFLLCINAGNIAKDVAWIQAKAAGFNCAVVDRSAEFALLAIQGPASAAIVQTLTTTNLAGLKYYHCTPGAVAGVNVLLARTGYTGEDGFELYCAAEDTENLWNAVMAAGTPKGLLPAGLGCRNTLRMECKMALYGHEIDDTIHALEAGLGWIVKLDHSDFIGREALLAAKAAPAPRKLVGFKTHEKRDIARDHMPVVQDGKQIGFVTSGAPSPTCGFNLGLAYVPTELAKVGGAIQIEIRGRAVNAEIIPTPFYKRTK